MKKTFQCLACVASLVAAVSMATFTTGCSGDRYSRSTGETIDDASITAKVKSELLADPQVKGMSVKVDTFRGQVQLTGFVDTFEQKQKAEQLARQVNGVDMVRNNIVVKEAAGSTGTRNYNRSTTDRNLDKDFDVDADVDVDVDKK